MENLFKYIKNIARKEGFEDVEVLELKTKNNDLSGRTHLHKKIIWINSVVPEDWMAKDVWELCLHEIAHLFPIKREMSIKQWCGVLDLCKNKKIKDPEEHTPSFWNNFKRLKRKYSFESFFWEVRA